MTKPRTIDIINATIKILIHDVTNFLNESRNPFNV